MHRFIGFVVRVGGQAGIAHVQPSLRHPKPRRGRAATDRILPFRLKASACLNWPRQTPEVKRLGPPPRLFPCTVTREAALEMLPNLLSGNLGAVRRFLNNLNQKRQRRFKINECARLIINYAVVLSYFGAGARPSTCSMANAIARSSRSLLAEPSMAIPIGKPLTLMPALTVMPGIPALLPGSALRMNVGKVGAFCPLRSNVSPEVAITCAGAAVVGKIMPTTLFAAK